MPKVGKRLFGYDAKGRKAAKAHSKKTGKKVVSARPKRKKKSASRKRTRRY
jgi:hypothetical protein